MRLAALGLFVFELASFPFSELTRDNDWSHARAPRVGVRDASQFVGPGQDSITIAGALVPEAAGSYGAIETLRAMANEGDAYEFVDGTGRIWGSYVVTRMTERRQALLDDGTPRRIDFTLDLERVA